MIFVLIAFLLLFLSQQWHVWSLGWLVDSLNSLDSVMKMKHSGNHSGSMCGLSRLISRRVLRWGNLSILRECGGEAVPLIWGEGLGFSQTGSLMTPFSGPASAHCRQLSLWQGAAQLSHSCHWNCLQSVGHLQPSHLVIRDRPLALSRHGQNLLQNFPWFWLSLRGTRERPGPCAGNPQRAETPWSLALRGGSSWRRCVPRDLEESLL